MTDKQIYGATKNNKVPGVARRAVQLGSSWQRGQSAVRVTSIRLATRASQVFDFHRVQLFSQAAFFVLVFNFPPLRNIATHACFRPRLAHS